MNENEKILQNGVAFFFFAVIIKTIVHRDKMKMNFDKEISP